jgi:hypothetical protein
MGELLLARFLMRGFAALVVLVSGPAAATTIEYDLVSLGGGSYRYVYTVTNDGSLGATLEGFDVFFDPALYLESSLSIVTPLPLAAEWDELILGSGVLISAAYDALGVAGGIPDGGSASGFAVEFVWLGSGTPGVQPYEIFDGDTFEVLESGSTTSVPEPAPMSLLVAGVAALIPMLRRVSGRLV